MEHVKHALQTSLPQYLRSLNIPSNVEGFSKLSQADWMKLAPLIMFALTIFIAVITPLFTDPAKKWKDECKRLQKELASAKDGAGPINQTIKKDEDKVVDTCPLKDIEDCEQKVFCRCWKSKKFPLCDGSHNSHNKETGDNVGPLIVKGGKSS